MAGPGPAGAFQVHGNFMPQGHHRPSPFFILAAEALPHGGHFSLQALDKGRARYMAGPNLTR
jgi:hypothetical protein